MGAPQHASCHVLYLVPTSLILMVLCKSWNLIPSLRNLIQIPQPFLAFGGSLSLMYSSCPSGNLKSFSVSGPKATSPCRCKCVSWKHQSCQCALTWTSLDLLFSREDEQKALHNGWLILQFWLMSHDAQLSKPHGMHLSCVRYPQKFI